MLYSWLVLSLLAALFAVTFEFFGKGVRSGSARMAAGAFLVLFLLAFVVQTSEF